MSADESIDDLIFRIANSDSERDREDLYEILLEIEVFSPIRNDNPDAKISLGVVDLDKKRMVQFFTEKNTISGKGKVAGMLGVNALKMIRDTDDADGLLIQSNISNAWFAISKPVVSAILHRAGY